MTVTKLWRPTPLDLIGPIALWTALAPTALGFDSSTSAAALASHIAFAMALLPLSIIALALRPALALCALGGAWLAISLSAAGYAHAGTAAWLTDLATGALLIMWAANRNRAHRTHAEAGTTSYH